MLESLHSIWNSIKKWYKKQKILEATLLKSLTEGTPTCSCGLEIAYRGCDGKYLKYRCPDVLGKATCRYRFPCSGSPYGYVLKLPVMKEDARRYVLVPHETKK